jgi:two-component sensor histidine kinase
MELEFMYQSITMYLILSGQAQKAYPYIKKLNEFAKHNNNVLDYFRIEQSTYLADSATGNFAGAYEHMKRAVALRDSIFNTTVVGQLNDLQFKYDTEKKDKNIKLLNSQNQLHRIRAENAENAKNITLGGIIVALVIIVLLFSLYRVKRRNNSKLEAHQRELDQKNAFLETLAADLQKLLKEKDWLVKEVHHRVKNNLQMVTSLLYSQSVYLEDEAAKRAVNDSLRRMQAMALIHQKLYQDENSSTVSMPEYIGELVHYLRESFETDEQIVFDQSIEAVKLDVSQAVPLGLIITESIVNAIKYAFLNEQSGTVNIILQHDETGQLVLEISDNGVGLPSEPELMERNSLGLDLIQGLAKQLGGTFTIKSEGGVKIVVRFGILNKQS